MKPIFIILIVVGVLALAATGIWYWNKKQMEKSNANGGYPAGTVELNVDEGQTATLPTGTKVIDATYGTNEKNNDVTSIVQALVDKGGSWQVTNDTMGGDPDQGKVKKLTIHYTTK